MGGKEGFVESGKGGGRRGISPAFTFLLLVFFITYILELHDRRQPNALA